MPDTITAPAARAGEKRADDLSDHTHRQLIGYTGLLLPLILILVAGVRQAAGPGRWRALDSVSAYYYTGAVAAFVGLLVALALFLFAYRGYRNRYYAADRAAAITAGVAALGVAFFPTAAVAPFAAPDWWRPLTGTLHYLSAALLFTMFAVFSLWLFRIVPEGEAPARDKIVRNRIYLACGVVIVASIAWCGVNAWRGRPIFLPECVALLAFAVSWLTKGYALRSIGRGARRVARMATTGSVRAPLLLAGLLSSGGAASAQVQVIDPYNPIIGGVPVYCVSGITGQPVAFVADPTLNDVGMARDNVIILNPLVLAQLPPKLQLFWYGHECGHHVLGMAVAMSPDREDAADRWAIRTGKEQGLFTRSDVVSFGPYFQNNPGSPWGHAPGPIRAQNFLRYYDEDEGQGDAGLEDFDGGYEEEFYPTLTIWSPYEGNPAEMEVYVDGEYVDFIANLYGAETIDLGPLSAGAHRFELREITAYVLDNWGNLQPIVSGRRCSGRFSVAHDQDFRLTVRMTGGTLRCAFD